MAAADTLRVATYHADLTRRGPGLLLRDILSGDDPQIRAVQDMIRATDADVLLLTGVDYDLDLAALRALADALAAEGRPYPHRFALRPNTGMATGLDLDGDGRRGGPRDAQGYGRFAGEGGMAVLSRLAIDTGAVRDFSAFLWRDLPEVRLPDGMGPDAAALQRLSTTGDWEVPLILPGGGTLRLLCWAATPPVFDGPEDRNGLRNRDEAAFWLDLLDGTLPMPPPEAPFVLLGEASLDAADGDGRRDALQRLLHHPALQDPEPRGPPGRTDPGHSGDPRMDTADYAARDGPGGLRVDYILPSAGLRVTGAGVLRPAAGSALAEVAARASRHLPVWVDLTLP
jgi:hypothetical protein